MQDGDYRAGGAAAQWGRGRAGVDARPRPHATL